jgi:Zn-dependent protease with chaperone function
MENDAIFKKYQEFTVRSAKKITAKPVTMRVNNNAHQKNAKAHMLKYSNPTHYTVVFSGDFYKSHKHNTEMIKDIILHEIAHIKEPYEHDLGFCEVVQKLGAPKRYCLSR